MTQAYKVLATFTVPGGGTKQIELTPVLDGIAEQAIDLILALEGGKIDATLEVTKA